MTQVNFIKGSMSYLILSLLEQRGKMYGYEITKTVKELSQGKIRLNEAALYPTLHQLCAEGWLDTETELVAGRLRKNYFLTSKGKKETVTEIANFKESLEALLLIFKNGWQHGIETT